MDVLHTGEKNPRFAPPDRYNLACFLMGMMGMGAMYPWNFFITAADYFHYSFRNTTDPAHPTTYQNVFENTLSIVATSCGVFGLIINTILTRYLSFKIRIYSGFIAITVIFTLTTVLTAVDTDSWQTGFFVVTMLSVFVINWASSWVNGGISGVQGCLPSHFSTAMMVGQAVAGLMASFASIFSVLSQRNTADRDMAVKNEGTGYFGSAVAASLLCTVGFAVFTRLPIVNYYLESLLTVRKIRETIDTTTTSTDYTKVVEETTTVTVDSSSEKFQFGLVIRRIWSHALVLMLTYGTTLAVFPAVASAVRSRNASDGSLINNDLFLPVACFLIVNAADFAGRLSHGFLLLPTPQQGSISLGITILRMGMIPMFLFCNALPREHLPVVFGDAVYVILLAVFIFTNGYFGNLGMMYGPKLVPPQFAETTGSIMALSLNTGLLLGSAFSFVLVYVL
ncbi:putative Equilibrative nucleoside transporter 3 [Hypsibius exemplaris]|uniref:Equilibrative nucleoside transporter 3 n=1 Tax=Hypsibius exemplaris TaxID=2072580 RepID=A0A1W0XDZ7_HYPEX|nr:putative Equilibrative nucleoside transporter 3 [Hypsibius exemplaris]